MAKTQTVTISLEEYRELLLKGKPSDRDHEILERILIEFEKNIVYSDYKYDSERIGEELVRCKDCKYYDDREWFKCPMLEPTEKDDYCSRAERKEE